MNTILLAEMQFLSSWIVYKNSKEGLVTKKEILETILFNQLHMMTMMLEASGVDVQKLKEKIDFAHKENGEWKLG